MKLHLRCYRKFWIALGGMNIAGAFVSAVFADTTAIWDGSVGDWTSAIDWSSNPYYPDNGTPSGAIYDVGISSGALLLYVNPTIQSLNFSGGTLENAVSGGTSLTVDGMFAWTGGAIGGDLTVNALAGMTLNGVQFGVGYGSLTINNSANAAWTGGLIEVNSSFTPSPNTFNNLAGATFNVQTDGTYQANILGSLFHDPDVFNNAGVFTKSVTTGTTRIDPEFDSSGQVRVQTGTLTLAGGGTESGAFSVTSDATLELLDRDFTFASASSLTGKGSVVIYSGTTTFEAGSSYSGSLSMTLTGPSLDLSFDPGTLDVAAGESITPHSLTLSDGAVNGAGTVTISELLACDSGSVGNDASNPTLNTNGKMFVTANLVFSSGTINNAGTAEWTGGMISTGTPLSGGPANTTFNNLAHATFDVLTDNYYGNANGVPSDSDVFNNAGTFTKSVTTGTTLIQAEFNNSGRVNVQSGTIILDAGGAVSGVFDISSGASLLLGGKFSFASGARVENQGVVEFLDGVSTFNSQASYSGSMLVGGGNFEFETTKKIALTSVGIDYGTLALGIDAGLLRMNSLSITTVDGGVLDLANNEVIINYGAGPDPISTIASYLVSGYASGAWNGPGINSSTAPCPPTATMGLAMPMALMASSPDFPPVRLK
jgi:hypothetical protein